MGEPGSVPSMTLEDVVWKLSYLIVLLSTVIVPQVEVPVLGFLDTLAPRLSAYLISVTFPKR